MKLCPTCKISYPDDYQTCPRDQSPLATPGSEIVPGTVIRGKYEIICELGAGGMATVYKAMHKAFHEIVALKVVHGQFMYDPDFVKRFRNEAIIVRQLKHPNAVRVEDFDYTEDGRPFIIMEFVDGRSLYDLRKSAPGPWPIDRSLDIICQVAQALSAAHTIGIVHRDIKPANILLLRGPNEELVVKVLDFGIAKVGANETFAGMTSVQTQQNLVIGTPEYMSPEQASGLLETVIDGRSDLYSLGLVLYELITGIPPFQADTPMGMLMQQVNTQPAPPESVTGNVPNSISALVLKCLKKDPALRFQSAAEMAVAMRDPEAWFASQQAKPPVTPPAPAPIQAAPIAPPPAPPAPLPIAPLPTPQPLPGQPKPMPGSVQPMPLQTSAKGGSSRLPYVLGGLLILLLALGGAGYYVVHTVMNKAKAVIATASSSSDTSTPTAPAEVPQPPPVVVAAAPAAMAESRPVSPPPTKPIPASTHAKPVVDPPAPAAASKESPLAKATEAEKLYSDKKYPLAFPLADEACEASVASGCFYVGRMYEKGLGVAQNYAQAAVVYRRACDGGIATSCINLGFMYDKGTGVAQNYQLAAALYQKACDGGIAAGCANLGIMYELGHGVALSKPDALSYYRKACDSANQPACNSVKRLAP